MDYLGSLYETGHGVQSNEREAARLFRDAVDVGDSTAVAKGSFRARCYRDAMTKLAKLYENGLGDVGKDEVKGADLYQRAMDFGSSEATFRLALMHKEGHGGFSKDDSEYVRLVRIAAEHAYVSAMVELGLLYFQGSIIGKNDTEAVTWFQKADPYGSSRGAYDLGVMYEKGLGGLPKDFEAAKRLYLKAAAMGDELGKKAVDDIDRAEAAEKAKHDKAMDLEERCNRQKFACADLVRSQQHLCRLSLPTPR
jgi:hypothetical protein